MERPIIFSAEMVRAILEGRKTQTRRVINPQPDGIADGKPYVYKTITVVRDRSIEHIERPDDNQSARFVNTIKCHYGKPGDLLWVRETCIYTPPCWADRESDYNIRDGKGGGRIIYYLADNKPHVVDCAKDYHLKTTPSIYMPRWASRITLEITGVRVERVQEITDTGGMREGWTCDPDNLDYLPRMWYRDLWNKINAKRGYSWASNPWVWVIEFKPAQVPGEGER